jgi:hypothetical protein
MTLNNSTAATFVPKNAKLVTSRWGLLLIFLVLVLSGNPITGLAKEPDTLFIIMFIFLFIGSLWKRQENIFLNRRFLILLALFVLIFFIQSYTFNFFPFTTYAGFLIRFGIGYMTYRLVDRFDIQFTIVICLLAFVSLFFFLVQVFVNLGSYGIPVSLEESIVEFPRFSFGIHTVVNNIGPAFRNCGMFSEPGLFAGYLNLAILFLIIHKTEMQKYFTRMFVILSLALFSTLSTQGYIVYFILVVFYFIRNFKADKTYPLRLVGLFLLVLAIGFSFSQLPFMQKKIETENNMLKYQEKGYEIKRIGGFVESLKYIESRPLTGWGLHSKTRTSLTHSEIVVGTGMTDFMAKVGVPMFVLLCYILYKYFRRTTGKLRSSIICLIIFLILIQGEPFFNYPIILSFFFF